MLNERKWFNIGSRDGYLEVHRTIAEDGWRPEYVEAADWPVTIGPEAVIDSTARLTGFNSIGAGCHVGPEAVLENTILWPGAQIASRSHLRNCIVRANQKAEGTLSDSDI